MLTASIISSSPELKSFNSCAVFIKTVPYSMTSKLLAAGVLLCNISCSCITDLAMNVLCLGDVPSDILTG